jgi:hypothetical protein
MIDRKFKSIDKDVWETSKRILNSLEAKSDNPNLEFFYTPLEGPLQLIFVEFESRMNEDCGKKCSKILLDVHEAIVAQVVTTKCACNCPPKTTRKSLEKTLSTQMSFTSVSGCEGLKVNIRRILPHLLISSFDIM